MFSPLCPDIERSSARAVMQIVTIVTFAALLTSSAALANPAGEPLKMPRTPATPKLLYVMEYDGYLDWEVVTLEQGVTNGVLAWMMQLQDRLTLTTQTPLGEKLMVSLSYYDTVSFEWSPCLPPQMNVQFSRPLRNIGSAWQCGR